MYDLHAHNLPGVDDGAKTLEDFLKMARVAAEQGTTVMLATPHRRDVTENHSVAYVRDHAAGMSDELASQGIELTLLLGMENHLDLDLPGDLSEGKALPMNGTRYALVELPFFGYPNYVEDVLFKLQVQGVTPVLAHPERIEAFQKDPERLRSFVERGMLSQVTAGSLVGHFGGRVKRLTLSMLRRGLVHVLASDTHFPSGPRSPELRQGMEAAARVVGEDRARAMVVDTPKAIIEGAPVEPEQPLDHDPGRRWWSFRRR
jgi:protein-tyrosine phosphatase